MNDTISYRELHQIERSPDWPHVPDCEGGCMGCLLEDAVLQAGGLSGREFLLLHMADTPKVHDKGQKFPDTSHSPGKMEPVPPRKIVTKLLKKTSPPKPTTPKEKKK